MRWLPGFLLLISLFTPTVSVAQKKTSTKPAATTAQDAPPAWKVEQQKRHDELIQANGPGTDAALRDRLRAMGAEDQAAPERGLTKVAPEEVERLRKSM